MRLLRSRLSAKLGSLILAVLVAFPSIPLVAQTDGLPPVPPEQAAVEQLPPAEAGEEGLEVLTRGPLHEAFATPVEHDPQPGDLVEQAPPEPIDEVPPEVKPEGDNVQWVPGYWAWDEQEERYIWISGVWRAVPPGREWMPGYWTQDEQGFRWVPGYWGVAPPSGEQVARRVYDAAREAQTYVAPPPESLEAGPVSPQPSDQHFWVPGCWIAADAGYRWRPGYWYQYHPNWVWVPDNYVWTPAGCIFVPGYWDYTLQARGMIFAPVYFTQPLYVQPFYRYRPFYALDVARVALHLFVHPWNRFYYFGDYYGPAYAGFGYRPWFHLQFGTFGYGFGRGYCPLLAYYHTHYRRHGIDYIGRVRGWHGYYDRHVDHRPPRRFDWERERFAAASPRERSEHRHVLARGVDEVRRERFEGQRRVVDVDRTAVERQRTRAEAVRDVARTRREMEQSVPREFASRRGDDARRAAGERATRERIVATPSEASREQFQRSVDRARQLARSDQQAAAPGDQARRAVERSREFARGSQPQAVPGDQARRAIERSRELARGAQEEARGRRPIIGAQSPQPQVQQRPDVVRGQQPERRIVAPGPSADAGARERVLQLERQRSAAEAARDRARERVQIQPQPQPRVQTEARPSFGVDQNRQALDAARRAQDTARDRQRTLEQARGQARELFSRPGGDALRGRGGELSPGGVQRSIREPAVPRSVRPGAVEQRVGPQFERRQSAIQERAFTPQRAQTRTMPQPQVRGFGRSDAGAAPTVVQPRERATQARSQAQSAAGGAMRAMQQRADRPAAGGDSPGRGRGGRGR